MSATGSGMRDDPRRNGAPPADPQPPPLDIAVIADIDRVRELREAARAFAEMHGVARADDVALAIGEACSNAAQHAYVGGAAGPMHLTGWCDGELVWFTVDDRGSGLAPRPDSPGLGLGLPIIAQVADVFELTGADGEGTRLRMGFGLAG